MHPSRHASTACPLIALFILALGAPQGTALAQSSVSFLQFPPGDSTPVLAGDGRTIVGTMRATNGSWSAFRWTQASGLHELPLPVSDSAWVGYPSYDGSAFVAYTTPAAPNTARTNWIYQNDLLTPVVLPATAPGLSLTSMSRDGNWIAGSDGSRVFRKSLTSDWSEIPISAPAGWAASATLSADGSVMAGSLRSNDPYAGRSYRWTSQTGTTYIDGPGPQRLFMGHVSPDGSTIWGGVDPGIDGNNVPVLFREGTGLQLFTNPVDQPDFQFWYGNQDASMLIATSGAYPDSYTWTQAAGLVPLSSLYAAAGVSWPGLQIEYLEGMSDDGRTFLWDAYRPSDGANGFLLITIPSPGVAAAWLGSAVMVASRRRRVR